MIIRFPAAWELISCNTVSAFVHKASNWAIKCLARISSARVSAGFYMRFWGGEGMIGIEGINSSLDDVQGYSSHYKR